MTEDKRKSLRELKGPQRLRRRVQPRDIERFVKCYDEYGWSCTKIANETGFSRKTVRNYIQKHAKTYEPPTTKRNEKGHFLPGQSGNPSGCTSAAKRARLRMEKAYEDYVDDHIALRKLLNSRDDFGREEISTFRLRRDLANDVIGLIYTSSKDEEEQSAEDLQQQAIDRALAKIPDELLEKYEKALLECERLKAQIMEYA